MAAALADTVEADALFLDDGTLNAEGNHRQAWDWHTRNRDGWALTVEDDALPVVDFRAQLTAALEVAPAPVVSLYLGTDGRHWWQSRIRHALGNARKDACWLVANGAVLHAVAVAIRADLLPLDLDPGVPTDAAISNWCKRHGHPVAYSLPSLVDHADGPSVITRRGDPHPRNIPRRAHQLGQRTHWTRRSVTIN